MAHHIEKMAYVGERPWHRLGNQLQPGQPLEVWAEQAGMAWAINRTAACYNAGTGDFKAFPGQDILFRSDTLASLAIVSSRYHVVQPKEILEFYRDLVDVAGFQLETAGVLKGGKKFWALARTGKEAELRGNDLVKSYLLLATSCDGSLATTATHTSVRVVCNNTLTVTVDGAVGAVKVAHNRKFDAQAVKKQLGVAVSQWDAFRLRMKALSERKVSGLEAHAYFSSLAGPAQSGGGLSIEALRSRDRTAKAMHDLFNGQGRGAELDSARGTAWGLVNAATQFVDHEKRARSQDNRMDSAWFGPGALLKQRALERALELAA